MSSNEMNNNQEEEKEHKVENNNDNNNVNNNNNNNDNNTMESSDRNTGDTVVDDDFIQSLIQNLESDMFTSSASTGPFGTKSPTKSDVLKELEKLEDEERQRKFLELQRMKEENDQRISGMVKNVHNLMESYGLDTPQESLFHPKTPGIINNDDNNDNNNNSNNNNNNNNNIKRGRDMNITETFAPPAKPSRVDSVSPPPVTNQTKQRRSMAI